MAVLLMIAPAVWLVYRCPCDRGWGIAFIGALVMLLVVGQSCPLPRAVLPTLYVAVLAMLILRCAGSDGAG